MWLWLDFQWHGLWVLSECNFKRSHMAKFVQIFTSLVFLPNHFQFCDPWILHLHLHFRLWRFGLRRLRLLPFFIVLYPIAFATSVLSTGCCDSFSELFNKDLRHLISPHWMVTLHKLIHGSCHQFNHFVLLQRTHARHRSKLNGVAGAAWMTCANLVHQKSEWNWWSCHLSHFLSSKSYHIISHHINCQIYDIWYGDMQQSMPQVQTQKTSWHYVTWAPNWAMFSDGQSTSSSHCLKPLACRNYISSRWRDPC